MLVKIEGEMTMADQQWPPTIPELPHKRQAINICSGSELSPIIALCNDGSIWYLSKNVPTWTRVLDIPQDETGRVANVTGIK